jgi:hypothetical protein
MAVLFDVSFLGCWVCTLWNQCNSSGLLILPTQPVWMVALLSDPAEMLVLYSKAPAIQFIRITLVLYWMDQVKSHALNSSP